MVYIVAVLLLGVLLVMVTDSIDVSSTFDNALTKNDYYLTTGEWWRLERSNDTLFNAFNTSTIYIRTTDADESGVHSCYDYKVVSDINQTETHHNTFCYPSIIITGYRKCSTSALYSLLSQYPGVMRSESKENCAFLGGRSIVQYFESLPRIIEGGKLLVDGCITLESNLQMRGMLRQPNTFYIVLLRDYANWVWSAYNYWCTPTYDRDCGPTRWVNERKHRRSPELFHEILQSSMNPPGVNKTMIASPLDAKQPCREGGEIFQRFVNQLWRSVPVENTLILASEDLENDPSDVWARISLAVGLDSSHPRLKEFSKVRYNTQSSRSSKGENAVVLASKVKPGLYAVSKNQPLLESSRSILNTCWRSDCLWSSRATGHSYPACINASASLQLPSVATAGNSAEEALFRYMSTRGNVSLTRPFLQRRVDTCRVLLDSRVSTRRLIDKTTTPAAMTDRVLILSLSKDDREFVRSFLRFSVGMHATVVEMEMTTGSLHNKDHHNSSCTPNVVITSPNNIRPSKSHPGMLELIHNKTHCVGRSAESDGFNRVVVLTSDSLMAVWNGLHVSLMQEILSDKSLSASALDGALSDLMVGFNWTRWEAVAEEAVRRQVTAGVIQKESLSDMDWLIHNSLWNAQHCVAIGALLPVNRMIVRMEDIRWSTDRLRHLMHVIQFITGNDSAANKLTHLQSTTRRDHMQCALMLTNAKIGHYHKVQSASTLALIHTSQDMVCRVNQMVKDNPLLKITLSFDNKSCVNGVSIVSRISSAKCRLRFTKRTFHLHSLMRLPIALISEGKDSVLVRQLIEHSTGILTGAMEADPTMRNLFPAEDSCGQRMSAVHVKPTSLDIRPEGVLGVSAFGTKICARGMIPAFQKALLVVRDPFVWVWREFHKPPEMKRSRRGVVQIAPIVVTTEEGLLDVTRRYSQAQLDGSDAFERLQNGSFNSLSVLVVSFEALVTPALVPPLSLKTATIASKRRLLSQGSDGQVVDYSPSPVSVLSELLSFAQFPILDPVRVECAFQFANTTTAVTETQRMHAYLNTRPQLLCALWRLFDKALSPNKFRFIRLYQDVEC